MPRRNGTGPMGYGPMTGRGMGNCGQNLGLGYGYGIRMGRRCGFGWPAGNTFSPNLALRKQMLEEELKQVNTLLSNESENQE